MSNPTKKDLARFRKLQDIGCIACRYDGHNGVPADIHHLLNGYRIGHSATIPLCPWHHSGVLDGSFECDRVRMNPSLANHKRGLEA